MTFHSNSPYKEQLDNMTWSFSRVDSYNNCPRGFKLQYINKVSKEQNAMAEWGILCHSLFERYFSGKLDIWDLADAYKNEYASIVAHAFPPNDFVDLGESYYNRGVELFSTFPGIESKYNVVAAEKPFTSIISSIKFTGVIDLILQDSIDGRFVIQDFKSKAKFKSKKEQSHYALQMYLYAKYIEGAYGELPKMLRFDMFRAGTKVEIPFNAKDYESAQKWLSDNVDSIYGDTVFSPKECDREKDFFCQHICSVRKYCREGDNSACREIGHSECEVKDR